MGLDIIGYVEYQEIGVWQPLIDAIFLEQDRDAFYRAFGIPWRRSSPSVVPLAPGRGLPLDVSAPIQAHFADPETRAGGAWHGVGDASWFSYAEVAERDWAEWPPDWQLLFRLMETLAAIFGDAQVRFVAWFFA